MSSHNSDELVSVDVCPPFLADDGCGGCVALRSGRTTAPLVGESGGSWSDTGVVGSRRGMASMFFFHRSEHSTETKDDIVPNSTHCLNPELSYFPHDQIFTSFGTS